MKNTKRPGSTQTTTQTASASQQANSNQQQKKSRFGWTGFADKTLWDWISVLLIPLMVGIGTIVLMNQQNVLSQEQHKSDRNIAEDNRKQDLAIASDQLQESVLKTYRDDIKDLIVNQSLLKSHPGDEVRSLAQSYTYDALRKLEADKNGLLVQFLSDLGLVSSDENNGPIILLERANLTEAKLSETHLSGEDLRWAILSGAELLGADLSGANLDGADLSESYLERANLRGVNLAGANLWNADLENNADLTGAKVDPYHLSEVSSLSGTTMPDGTKCADAKETLNRNEQEQIKNNCIARYKQSYDKDPQKYGG